MKLKKLAAGVLSAALVIGAMPMTVFAGDPGPGTIGVTVLGAPYSDQNKTIPYGVGMVDDDTGFGFTWNGERLTGEAARPVISFDEKEVITITDASKITEDKYVQHYQEKWYNFDNSEWKRGDEITAESLGFTASQLKLQEVFHLIPEQPEVDAVPGLGSDCKGITAVSVGSNSGDQAALNEAAKDDEIEIEYSSVNARWQGDGASDASDLVSHLAITGTPENGDIITISKYIAPADAEIEFVTSDVWSKDYPVGTYTLTAKVADLDCNEGYTADPIDFELVVASTTLPKVTLTTERTAVEVGDSVTLTATMSGAESYAGKVQFSKNGEKLEDGLVDLTEGVAEYTWIADETATFSAEYVPALGDPLSAATSIAVEVTVEAAPQPEPEPEPIPAIEPLPDPAADKTPQGEATVEEIEGGTVTTQPNSDGSTTVITETYNPSTGYTNVLTVVTEESGAFASKEIETAPDGSITIIDEYADASGDNTYAQTIDMDKDGNVTGTYVGSKTTVNGVVTETHEAETAEGKTVYEKVTQANEDFTEKTEVFSPEGLLIQSDESSKETAADGTVTEKEKNFTDGVTAEQTKVTGTDGSSTVSSKLTLVNGNVSEQTVKNDGKGAVEITGSDTLDGQKSEYALSGTENGLTLTKETGAKGTWTVFDVFAADDGKSYPVVALGAGVFENNKELTSLTVGEGIVTFEKGALAGCSNLTELNLTGVAPNEAVVASNGKSKSNIKLMKNSLKGTNKKLKILVKNKADQKAVKKQLKKAGNKKAKVKVLK